MIGRFIEHFTYLGLFLTLFAAALGLPIPEEVPILAGGVLAQQEVVRWWRSRPDIAGTA
jgi:membrane protein DedA with SNARE-associated domain